MHLNHSHGIEVTLSCPPLDEQKAFCPACDEELTADAVACDHCGHSFVDKAPGNFFTRKRSSTPAAKAAVGSTALLALIIIAVIFKSPTASAGEVAQGVTAVLLWGVVTAAFVGLIYLFASSQAKTLTDGHHAASAIDAHFAQFGFLNGHLVCPHCQTIGQVRTKQAVAAKGISGSKATAALFTSGLSLLFTGLSRKENELQCHCDHCGVTWHVG